MSRRASFAVRSPAARVVVIRTVPAKAVIAKHAIRRVRLVMMKLPTVSVRSPTVKEARPRERPSLTVGLLTLPFGFAYQHPQHRLKLHCRKWFGQEDDCARSETVA